MERQSPAERRGARRRRCPARRAARRFSKTLLNEISNTGTKTKNVFQSSIADLNKTVVTSLLHDNEFHSALAIDIMDRNLYERANDCRWWALTATFAELLSKPSLSEADRQTIRSMLQTINGLYTVYSNLIVFDRSRRIVAVSAEDSRDLEGTVLDEEWASRILSLRGDQSYAVSPFAPTHLYKDRPTYIYGAAIADPKRQGIVGGVAIVFDSEPQFNAMLVDALPRDGTGAVKRGAFGLLVEPRRQDHLLLRRASAPRRDHCDRARRFCSSRRAAAIMASPPSATITMPLARRRPSGYREYKGADDAYRNNVVALDFHATV